jgi:hypothetical protein
MVWSSMSRETSAQRRNAASSAATDWRHSLSSVRLASKARVGTTQVPVALIAGSGAVEGGALALADRADRRAALRAGLALAPVHRALGEEVARLALGGGEIAQRGAAFLDGAGERVAHRVGDAVPARRAKCARRRARIAPRAKERLDA